MGIILALAEPPFELGLKTVHQFSCGVSSLKRLTTRRIATTDMLNKQAAARLDPRDRGYHQTSGHFVASRLGGRSSACFSDVCVWIILL
jgi:hypothetical protein